MNLRKLPYAAALFSALLLTITPSVGQAAPRELTVEQQAELDQAKLDLDFAINTSGLADGEAQELVYRAYQTKIRLLGWENRETLEAAGWWAYFLEDDGKLDEAIALKERVVRISAAALGEADEDTLEYKHRLIYLYIEREEFNRALALAENAYSNFSNSDERELANKFRRTLAYLYEETGDPANQELIIRERLRIYENSATYDTDLVNGAKSSLQSFLFRQSRFSEAVELAEDRLVEYRQRLGASDFSAIVSARRLADIYNAQGRYGEAGDLLAQAIEDYERVRGEDAYSWTALRREYAKNLADAGRLDLAIEELRYVHRRLSSIGARTDAITIADRLSEVLLKKGEFAEARQLLVEVLAHYRQYPGRSVGVYAVSNNLGEVLQELGEDAAAEAAFGDAAEGYDALLGRAHLGTLRANANLLRLSLRQPQRAGQAYDYAVPLVEGLRQRRTIGRDGEAYLSERQFRTSNPARQLSLFADAAWALSKVQAQKRSQLQRETFVVLQEAITGAADEAIAAQAAKRYFGSSTPQVVDLINERRELEQEWQSLNTQIGEALADRDNASGTVHSLTDLRAEIKAKLARIDVQIGELAPDYISFVNAQPLKQEEAIAMLEPDEVVLMVVPSEFGTHTILVDNESVTWHRSDWEASQVSDAVERLRLAVGAKTNLNEEQVYEILGYVPQENELIPFPRHTAFELYQQVVGSFAKELAGKRRVYVTAGGTLSGLPFHLLVSERPIGPDHDWDMLRNTKWFGDAFALVHLPSLQSLVLLRRNRSDDKSSIRSFLGVGNPILAGRAELRGFRGVSNLRNENRLFKIGRTRSGSPVDIAMLRGLPSLPGTQLELEAIREIVAPPSATLLVEQDATEEKLRAVDISAVDLIVFATHGLTADEAKGSGEPGLVLTPPDATVEELLSENDGYLSASEVAGLRLNARWVILSACNTASGDGESRLSALARSFFFAGTDNLLASHWPVSDDVAPVITSRTLGLRASGMSGAEAFQQALQEVRNGGIPEVSGEVESFVDDWAHPFYWAPFVLMGDAS